ncbi:MAG: mannose-1-phosphate guanylyltransferase/mannose-6-phosphate isomerase [Pseudomonadota bacterium]
MTDRPLPVILSGGAGSRLWPVSRHHQPKPFLALPDGETLALKTLRRAARLGGGAAITVTGADHRGLTETVAGAPGAPELAMHYVLEPLGRNTAPAIAAAAHLATEVHGAATVMLVMPADHLIEDIDAFETAVLKATKLAAQGHLVTFGIAPEHPETGYGYIRRGEAIDELGFRVDRFVEKPDLERAKAYVADGQHAWNAGIFCFRADRFLEELAVHEPEMAAAMAKCWERTDRSGAAITLDAESFAATPANSVDYAVMERSTSTAVVPCRIGWSDVGSWAAIRDLSTPDDAGNRLLGDALVADATDCFVAADGRVVALVGVEDLVVVDTPDALLIAGGERTQGVKQIVDQLKPLDHPTLRDPAIQQHDWGTSRVLDRSDAGLVLRLDVAPGASFTVDGPCNITVLAGSIQQPVDRSGHRFTPGSSINVGHGPATHAAGESGATVIETRRKP